MHCWSETAFSPLSSVFALLQRRLPRARGALSHRQHHAERALRSKFEPREPRRMQQTAMFSRDKYVHCLKQQYIMFKKQILFDLFPFSFADPVCSDQYHNCMVVVQARLCIYPYYKGVCCASCARAQKSYSNAFQKQHFRRWCCNSAAQLSVKSLQRV